MKNVNVQLKASHVDLAALENGNRVGNRVQCLYRVSTDQQVSYNAQKEADIPMQRIACHRFAENMGWKIVFEDQEEGISGHKIRAENRDKIQLIKERAKKHQFDILLVFMFDRIGRIADETPFVVEWFVKNGIRVWSTEEGEQKFENHTDKLMNYIRFWQADGESEKTSIRTSTSMRQLTEQGFFTGGPIAYGYRLVEKGRRNKRGYNVLDPEINEEEAAIVKLIFEKYVQEGYGAQRISTFLYEQGIKNRSGKNFHPTTIYHMLQNPLYTGVLRAGESYSPILPHLAIIDEQTFARAQEIRSERTKPSAEPKSAPYRTTDESLLSGRVFCGSCGNRLILTTNVRKKGQKPRFRYICYGKTRRQCDCTGQTGYTMHILDGVVNTLLQQFFSKFKSASKQEVVSIVFAEKLSERQTLLRKATTHCNETLKEVETLKREVLKAINGESAFAPELLNSMIAEAEAAHREAEESLQTIQENCGNEERLWENYMTQYDELITWTEMYTTANIATQKMIIASLIERIDVYRDYDVKIKFNISIEQFLQNLE